MYKQEPALTWASAERSGMEHDRFPRGVKLTRNDLGGMTVDWNGTFIGWLHASLGDKWHAYVRGQKVGDPGRLIGRYTKDEAVRRIALEAGWREPK